MEVTIGIQNQPRELAFETTLAADEIAAALKGALEKGGLLELSDVKGQRFLVPTATIGYVEVGPEETRRVGFGSL
ncbi:MAG: DUF3107 domain-containing protein [Promicromonosporaceae bacterium]|nr:DUF3107 domain-containing protein [Promicromonosporaceae bacterium]